MDLHFPDIYITIYGVALNRMEAEIAVKLNTFM